MKTVFVILAYLFAILVPFLSLLYYGKGSQALLTFILSLTGVLWPVAAIIGVIKVHEARAERGRAAAAVA